MPKPRDFGKVILGLATLYLCVRAFMFPLASTITWDAFGYYLYLPITFVHDDLGLRDQATEEATFGRYEPSGTFYQAHAGPLGGKVIRYTPGVALLNAPAFLLAHAIAPRLGYPADGLSPPYRVAMLAQFILYVALGLWFLLKVLEALFDPKVAAIAFVLLILGTNLLVYLEKNPLLTHGYSFTLFAMLLWITHRWHQHPTMRSAFSLGALLGLIALVRPPDAVVALMPLAWPLAGTPDWKAKMHRLWKSHRGQLLLMIVTMIVFAAPMFLYWKAVSGSWIYDSYDDPGEGIDLFYPHLLNFLFSFRKGWLLYTPLMFFAMAGLVMLLKRQRQLAWALLAFVIVDVYLCSCWTLWYYPGGFGQRAMLETYPIMAIGLAAFIQAWASWSTRWRGATAVLIAVMVLLNLHQSQQYRDGVFDPPRVTPASYAAMFFDRTPDPEKQRSMLIDRPADTEEHFEPGRHHQLFRKWDPPMEGTVAAPDGSPAFRLDTEHIYSPTIEATYSDATDRDHAWLRITAMIWCDSAIAQSDVRLVATFEHEGRSYKYRDVAADKLGPIEPGRWSPVQFDYLTPEPRRPWDRFKVYGWFRSGAPVYIKDLRVESWVPGP